MAVPDKTMFGPRPDTTGITYGEVRQIKDDDTKIQFLKLRLDAFLISQIDKISLRDNTGHPNIWSPFPLLAMTFLGIETVGHVICDVEKIKLDNSNEHSKFIVTPVYYQIDKGLSHSPSKKFKEAFGKLHGKGSKKYLTKYSDVIHKYQRNTFNHGYQSRGVFIHHKEPKAWTVNDDQGTIVINPYLFWDQFKKAYDNIFLKISNGQEPDWRQNALNYFHRLLD